MNSREMKKALKYFLAREIFLQKDLQDKFLVLEGLMPTSEATERRFTKVILELREESK
ncbi:unnamed protein product [marine sediment metagenome]|jgi:hypothetical protein|uniref:Uncharacterized protein n=1 Tax=marine sediment metagenome TaxID=412755 RepID=X1TRU0_9ZZZZ|tara:strand:- start:585 stop:758 length:174 start_codon:yes stop_codon:yes gene_type:complete